MTTSNNPEAIVIKFGGGLITDKYASVPTVKKNVLQQLAKALKQALDENINIKEVYLVHGAGSFGHPRAKHWHLSGGKNDSVDYVPDGVCFTQEDALKQVRLEMIELSKHVTAALQSEGLSVISNAPHEWARNNGPNFYGNLAKLQPKHRYEISLTWGDAVNVDDETHFGILSGDDLVVRLATEIPNVKRLIFCVGGGIDGILRRPPDGMGGDRDHFNNSLITVWCPKTKWNSYHDTKIDVTGGIGLKAQRGALVADICPHIAVQIINGEQPKRVLKALLGKKVLGTIIKAKL
jgi:isopentenyl phosphate kinase